MILRGVVARILAEDVPALYDFYTEKLGFKVLWGDRTTGYVSFVEADAERVEGKPAFAIFLKSGMKDYEGYVPLPGGNKSDQIVCCLGVEDVDVAYENLKSRGVEFIGAPRNMPDWYMRCVYFRDPEGNLFEISSTIKN